MKSVWITAKRLLPLLLGAGAFVFSWFIPATTLDGVTSELVALFGFVMAAVLPTMVLTASVLRASNLSVKRINDYSAALTVQMRVWVGLFLIALFSCLCVILGKATGWNIIVETPAIGGRVPSFSLNFARLFAGFTWLGLVLTVARALAVGKGIMSLLTLSAELALGEARARDRQVFSKGDATITSLPEGRPTSVYVELSN